ncbi:MAG: DUF4268 domain-containing protein [Chloroflexi bacterium]|nr:DUF4268 domain-containing protein [Chloroflexota bacterium]
MAEPQLGSMGAVDVRTVWPHEAGDFTPWLAENIGELNSALRLDIEITQTEAPVGAFSLDILGKVSGTDDIVIIENQLERTDHGHLGQLIAYAAGLDARIVVWVSPDIREEHRDAIRWLNEHTTDTVAFFAVRVEVWRIDDSLPAPRFNVVAEPSGFQRDIVQTTIKPSDRGLAYQKFFRAFVERLHKEHPGLIYTNPERVRYDSWTTFGAGRSGFELWVAFAEGGRFRVALTITTGDKARNKAAFDELHAQRDAIQGELNEPLKWERLDDWISSRAGAYQDGSIDSSSERLEELTSWAAELFPMFRAAFEPRIKALDLDALLTATNEEAAP